MSRQLLGSFFLILGWTISPWLAASPAQSKNPTTSTGSIRPASFQVSNQCQFTYIPAQVGERYRKQVHYVVDLKTEISQSGQTVANSRQRMIQQQLRRVEVLGRQPGLASAVRVTFEKARQQIGASADKMQNVPQPVQGNAYIVARQAEHLVITNADGSETPAAEKQIVRTAMEGVGRPNPIGEFLHGKTVAVGQAIELPKEVAASVFAAGGNAGPEDIRSFVLTLRKVGVHADRPSATFDTEVVMEAHQESNGETIISGRMILDVESCRAVSADISGPLHLTEQRGPKEAPFTVEGQGIMQLATRTTFETAIR